MWLTARLMPDFKTIARFRTENGKAIRSVCKQFIVLCRELGLFTQAIVAIDGSKFKTVNSRYNCYTQAKIQYRMKQVEDNINHYLSALDMADRQESALAPDKAIRLNDRLDALKKQMQQLQTLEAQVQAAPDKQIVLTDPDARFMATSNSGSGLVAYNVQTAVDTQHHLIVAHEVTNVANDRGQLSAMAKQAREAIGTTELTALADRGYFKSEEILACHNAGITACVPKPLTSGNRAHGLFDRRAFRYDVNIDEDSCPAEQSLIKRYTSIEQGKTLHTYWSSVCPSCPLKARCTTGQNRRVKRWEHEAVLDAMQKRLDAKPDAMLIRKQTVEHPYGTIKAWMGSTHFQTKTLERVSTEMSLQVLAYNLKRVMKIVGNAQLIQVMRA